MPRSFFSVSYPPLLIPHPVSGNATSAGRSLDPGVTLPPFRLPVLMMGNVASPFILSSQAVFPAPPQGRRRYWLSLPSRCVVGETIPLRNGAQPEATRRCPRCCIRRALMRVAITITRRYPPLGVPHYARIDKLSPCRSLRPSVFPCLPSGLLPFDPRAARP